MQEKNYTFMMTIYCNFSFKISPTILTDVNYFEIYLKFKKKLKF